MSPAPSASSDVAPTASGDHPDWCWPATCETAGAVTMHYSAPIVWSLTSDDVAGMMRRAQEGSDGEVMIEMTFTRQCDTGETITMLLSEQDVDRMFTMVHELRGCR